MAKPIFMKCRIRLITFLLIISEFYSNIAILVLIVELLSHLLYIMNVNQVRQVNWTEQKQPPWQFSMFSSFSIIYLFQDSGQRTYTNVLRRLFCSSTDSFFRMAYLLNQIEMFQKYYFFQIKQNKSPIFQKGRPDILPKSLSK